ncbi:MAG: DMT family transporter [Prevotellaceae bacterium]|jgi:drug/metabolite transporter (DMT)-like permease|nr:DMT family transporter [Prevotellaceae bacterium]
MSHFGELLSLAVAFFWTGSALAFEYAGKRIGSLMVNILRLIIGGIMLGGLLWIIRGNPLPAGADTETWAWMLLSGLVGFVFGDMCLFHSYLIITSRFSQLIMTLAPPTAAVFGFLILGEHMRPMGIIAMIVTLLGIGMAIFSRGGESKKTGIKLNLPLKGVLLAFGGAIGQGLGIVLSKKGMESYAVSNNIIANQTDSSIYIPFAATQIRIIAGIVGFILVILFMRQAHRLRPALNDKRAMASVTIGSFCGPFAGVSLSLMAVRYTETGIASTIMALVPIIIIIPSMLLFKQKITVKEVTGAIICVIGVALFFIE